ncbi:hypothetical protein I302_100349 [Kwoniella bestiolae CBS 10118]|uniref:Mid2 domain-containing protein n=1 Tax=Kwoniella bestiolae CBS 10118 TaxID=1296100 RepID=A0A1B9G4T2_9TREE|nr:hypothetical protein I302_03721 [Kwoniella bestiolae CBS 10118]OCF26044.1 hypothetical protein I302_03721 [Kwoniella bestiolae CBS 10118]
MRSIHVFRVLSLAIPYLMWFHFPLHALAQSTTASRSATASPSTTVYTGTPSLVFGNVPTMTACSSGLILWNVYNEDPSKVNITLYAINEGIDQSIPSPSTTAAATTSQTSRAAASSTAAISSQVALASSPRPTATTTSATSIRPSVTVDRRRLDQRTILDLNITLVTQLANHGWGFNPVRLPEGRYYILGVVDDARQTTNRSNVFSVVESDDTACLSAFKSLSASATATATNKNGVPTQKVTSIPNTAINNSTGSGSSEDNNDVAGKSGIGGGAIAGIVIGVLAGIIALALLYFCCRRRKRNGNGDSGEGGFIKFGGHKIHHHKMPSDTTAPSDSNHKNPIAMTPVHIRADDSFRSESDEKRGSLNSMEQDKVENLPLPPPASLPISMTTPISASYTTASSMDGSPSDRRRSDPFTTPTLGEIPAMSPIHTNSEIRKLGYPHHSTDSAGITPPQPVILANVRRSSQEESPRPGVVGLGINSGSGSGAGLKSANSFNSQSSLPYHQKSPIPLTTPPVSGHSGTNTGQSRSEPGKKRSSLQGLGSPTSTSTSADPNTFAIPSGNTTPPSGGNGLSRSTSSRRKPVPSLGPELRTELARQGSLKDLKNGSKDKNTNGNGGNETEGGRRRSYKLMPDPPIIQE